MEFHDHSRYEGEIKTMSLSLIQTGIQPKPFRMILHGTEGIGKSTFAKFAPKPVFIQTENGLDQIDVPKFPLASTFDEVKRYLQSLLDERHEYLTVVIDSVDWLEKLASQKILSENRTKKTLAEFDFGKGYARLVPLFEDIISTNAGLGEKNVGLLHRLREEKKMNVVFIAHTKIEKIEDPTGTSYDQYAPRLDKRINGMVKEWCDIIGFASHNIRKEEQKEGFGQTRSVAKTTTEGGTDRCLALEGTPAITAKNRYKMPSQMPLDGKVFFRELWKAVPLAPLYPRAQKN